MDVRAILVIGGLAPSDTGTRESIAGIPIAYLDVLGAPVVAWVLQRLLRCGVSRVNVLSDATLEAELYARRAGVLSGVPHIQAKGEQLWNTAEETFQKFSEDGAELVVVMRVGPYVDLDYDELLQHHLDTRCSVTPCVDSTGAPLELFVLNASARKDAGTLFRSQFQKLRRECQPLRVTAYTNRLQNASDLRRLGLDALMGKNSISPLARESKPGVWVGRAARIHPKARIVAPAYIGAHTRIRASALITRGTVVEHHAEVDCGTVVENSTVLPYTCVGAGLDVMQSVVGFRRIVHLPRNVEVEVSDKRLVGMAPLSPASRIAGSTAAAFAFLPKKLFRAVSAASGRKSAARTSGTREKTVAPSEEAVMETQGIDRESSEFPSNLAVARRYGDH